MKAKKKVKKRVNCKLDEVLDLNIKRIDVNSITPAEYNPRISTERGIYHLGKSLEVFGYVDPIILNEKTMTIVGGHQRFSVLVREGARNVDCVVLNLTEEKEKALNIALNKTSEHFEWDVSKLNKMLSYLQDDDIDLTSIGFVGDEVEDLDMQEFFDDAERIEREMKDDPRQQWKKFIVCPKCKAEVSKETGVKLGVR